MNLVVDCSVALKWYLEDQEQDVRQAEAVSSAISTRQVQLYAPVHWNIEVLAVLSRLNPYLVDEAIGDLNAMGATIINTHRVLSRAGEMASALKQPMFDTLYHAVAIETGSTLVTADERYVAKAHAIGHLSLLSNFEPL